jgi:hypothetical protein
MIRRMLCRLTLLSLAAVAVVVTQLHGQQSSSLPAASLKDALQRKFEELHKAGSFPGGTAGFLLADGTSFGIAVGVSDRTTNADEADGSVAPRQCR